MTDANDPLMHRRPAATVGHLPTEAYARIARVAAARARRRRRHLHLAWAVGAVGCLCLAFIARFPYSLQDATPSGFAWREALTSAEVETDDGILHRTVLVARSMDANREFVMIVSRPVERPARAATP